MQQLTNNQYAEKWRSTYNNHNQGGHNTQLFSSNTAFYEAINNMFLYGNPRHPTRIQTYELSLAELKSLLNVEAPTPNNQIRIHMAMYSDFGGYGDIGHNRPTFTPIMDSFHLNPGEVEHPTFYTLIGNSKKLTPITNSAQQPQLLPSYNSQIGITRDQAETMINSYNNGFGVDVGAGGFSEIFMSKNDQHPNRMLSGFVVGSQDTNSLVDHIKNHGDHTNLYLHLGYLGTAPLPANDWFNFRFILQINGTGNEAGQAFYYEFSKPCPPACGGGYVEKPLDNTLA